MSRRESSVRVTRARAARRASGRTSRKVSSGRYLHRSRHRRDTRLVCAAARAQRRRMRTWSRRSSGRLLMRSTPSSSPSPFSGQQSRALRGGSDRDSMMRRIEP
uniref:Uncharacterized protein n=1 Tax=Arundo donax TaxID=35708 RepID=A0A0A9HI33_ARUDO